MRTLHPVVLVSALIAAAGSALAQPHHEEIQVARNANGVLHMHTHAHMPFPLEPSPFPGIDGYAGAEVGLASIPSDHPAIGLFMLPNNVDIRAVLVAQDPDMQVFGGANPLPVGGELVLDPPDIHYLPVWNIHTGSVGQEHGISFFLRDAPGSFADSQIFTITFTPLPAPGALGPAAMAGLLALRRRR
jgi:hypothetical protein